MNRFSWLLKNGNPIQKFLLNEVIDIDTFINKPEFF